MAEQLEAPKIDLYYMRMTDDQANARLGKLKRGQVVALGLDQARAFLSAGVAEQVSSAEYEQQQERRRQSVSARQEAFFRLNAGDALWDVSTHRDVLTASDMGLRAAYDAGMPLANLQYLKDADGNELTQDSDIEEILEARATQLHPYEQFPQEAHDKSSVMGGGSHFGVQGGPQPLTPKYREFAQRLAAAEPFSHQQHAVAADEELGRKPPPTGERGGRAARRSRAIHGSQPPAEGTEQPPPPPPSGEQIGNG